MAMRRGKRLGPAPELKAPLLPEGYQVQNSSRSAAVVFGNDDAGAAGELVEMDDFNMARGGYRRRRTDGNNNTPDDDLVYVWHELEPHHTLAGIALQYRVTVAQIKSANQLINEAEIITRKRLMIPAHKYGVLYNNPEEYTSEDIGTTTHTTANPKPPDMTTGGDVVFDPKLGFHRAQSVEMRSNEAFIIEEGAAGPAPAEDPHRNASAEYLASFDSQMQTAIKATDSIVKKQAADEDRIPMVRLAPAQEGWEIQFSSWKTAVVALSVVLLVSFSTVFLYKFVSAPNPHA